MIIDGGSDDDLFLGQVVVLVVMVDRVGRMHS